jgi:hypothetical protein
VVDAAYPLRQPGVAWIGAHQIMVEGFVHAAFTMWLAPRLGKRAKRPGPDTPASADRRADATYLRLRQCLSDNALSDRLWRL